MDFGLSGSKYSELSAIERCRIIEVSVRRGSTVLHSHQPN